MKVKIANFFRVFGIILFIYLLSKINLSELAASLKMISLKYYLLAILFLISGFLVRIWKWRILINSVGANLPAGRLVNLSFYGFFWGLVTPGKLGEFLRAKYLSQETGLSGGKAFYTAFTDRILDILVITVIGFSGLGIIYYKFGRVLNWQAPVLILIILAVFLYFMWTFKIIQKIPGILIKFFLSGSFKEKANSFLADFYQGFASLKLKVFLKTLALSFLYYFFAGFILHYFTAMALGIAIPFWYLFLTIAIIWIVMMLPVSFLGLGTREAAFIYFFSFLNIPAHSAVAVSLLAFLGNIIALALPGSIIFLKRK